jgi:hypothetical protein
VLEKLLSAVLGAVFGAVVDGINAWRRDRALRDLGYSEAQIAQVNVYKGDRDAQLKKALNRRPGDGLSSLRDGSF